MSFKRRLLSLENRLAWIPPVRQYPLSEQSRKELMLPLPEAITQEEFDLALSMLLDAKEALRQDLANTEPLKRYITFAQSMHDKYAGEFARKKGEP